MKLNNSNLEVLLILTLDTLVTGMNNCEIFSHGNFCFDSNFENLKVVIFTVFTPNYSFYFIDNCKSNINVYCKAS